MIESGGARSPLPLTQAETNPSEKAGLPTYAADDLRARSLAYPGGMYRP